MQEIIPFHHLPIDAWFRFRGPLSDTSDPHKKVGPMTAKKWDGSLIDKIPLTESVSPERGPNSDVHGNPFESTIIEKVWEKGKPMLTQDPDKMRLDKCNRGMERAEYGKESEHGWEIDHIKPVAKGGKDELKNLQPLQWKNNRQKGDTYPWNGK